MFPVTLNVQAGGTGGEAALLGGFLLQMMRFCLKSRRNPAPALVERRDMLGDKVVIPCSPFLT